MKFRRPTIAATALLFLISTPTTSDAAPIDAVRHLQDAGDHFFLHTIELQDVANHLGGGPFGNITTPYWLDLGRASNNSGNGLRRAAVNLGKGDHGSAGNDIESVGNIFTIQADIHVLLGFFTEDPSLQDSLRTI